VILIRPGVLDPALEPGFCSDLEMTNDRHHSLRDGERARRDGHPFPVGRLVSVMQRVSGRPIPGAHRKLAQLVVDRRGGRVP
jgi:hypothetical protein